MDIAVPTAIFLMINPSIGRNLWFLERRLRRIRPPRTRWDHAFAVGCSLERKRMEHRGVHFFWDASFSFSRNGTCECPLFWWLSPPSHSPPTTQNKGHQKVPGWGWPSFFLGGYYWLVLVYGTFSHFFEINKKEQTQSSSTPKIRSSETWTSYPSVSYQIWGFSDISWPDRDSNSRFCELSCWCDRSCVASLHRSSFLWSVGHLGHARCWAWECEIFGPYF